MSLRNQIEAAIRSAGGDFSEASHAVCKLLDGESLAEREASYAFEDEHLEGDFIED